MELRAPGGPIRSLNDFFVHIGVVAISELGRHGSAAAKY
jgi:hypothetical protein